jgi:hypothetical protein
LKDEEIGHLSFASEEKKGPLNLIAVRAASASAETHNGRIGNPSYEIKMLQCLKI